MNNRYVYLLKNTGLFALSRFSTKLMSFLLVPLYTNILTTAEYGTFDLFSSTVSVLETVLTLNVQAAVLRFTLEKSANRKAIVSVAMKCFLAGCGITLFGIAVNGMFHLSKTGEKYAGLFFFMFFVRALSEIIFAYTRGIEKLAELSVSSVVASAVTIGCNIVFLAIFQWGLSGYFLANILGPLFQCLYLLKKSHMFGEINLKQSYRHESKNMLRYSVPLIANTISWWINASFDRYVILVFCGVAENGVYSVASKIPTILNTIRTVFEQAWNLSAVADYDSDDKSGFFSNTYKAYNCSMVIMCSVIIVLDRVLAKFLFAKDFYAAWKYVPWLTVAVVFTALSGYMGGIFSAVKDSGTYAKSTSFGAALNIVLNITVTPFIGALGAAVSTTICYIAAWALQLHYLKRYMKLNINIKRDVATYVLLIVQSIALLLFAENIWLYIVEMILFGMILMLYWKDIAKLWLKAKSLFVE